MTAKFDNDARATLAIKQSYVAVFSPVETFKYNGLPLDVMEIKSTPISHAREIIASYHYTKTMPDSTKYAFAGYLDNCLAGVITYGMGTGKNQYTALVPDIENGQYLELTRLWSPDGMPKNTESKIIGMSLKMLPPEIKLIVSFADPSRGHAGTIYQATNFFYCGTSGGGKMLMGTNGIEKHTRLIGIYRMRHPEYASLSNQEIMDMFGWKYVKSSGKHRYVFIRGTKKEKKRMLSQIQPFIKPYPKTTGNIEGDSIASRSGEIRVSDISPLSL